MKSEIWLKIEGRKKYTKWEAGSVHAFKTKPATNEREVAIKLIIEIPDAIFDEPVFEAKVSLPEVTRIIPDKTEIAKNVSAALSKELGFKVRLEMNEPNQMQN